MTHKHDARERLVTDHPGSKRRGKGRSHRQRRLDSNRARRDTLAAKIATLNSQIRDETEDED